MSKLIRSKTFWFSLLGVVALVLLAAPEYVPGVPEKVSKIFATLSLFLTTFGLVDAANMSMLNVIKKIKEFIATTAGAGPLVMVINSLIDSIPNLTFLPEGAITALYILGAFLTVLGLREKIIRARLNNSTIPITLQEKYVKK